jgi:hypothetical protein
MKTKQWRFLLRVYFFYEDFWKMIFFGPMMKALAPLISSYEPMTIQRKFFCACKSKWKRLQTPVPSMASQANDLKNLSCCRCAPAPWVLTSSAVVAPPAATVTLLVRFRNSSCCHAHVYYAPTRSAPQCRWMDGWMDRWMDECMVFFFSFFLF